MSKKVIIYQILPRLFGNKNLTHKKNGDLAENGVGKMMDIDYSVLQQIHDMGITHIWFTGIIRHASVTDYSDYGVPSQNSVIVKGKAGSPYAITDYYDVDPDLAVNVEDRMNEFKELVSRTHKTGMKVILDFVPNHVARQYKSIAKPSNVKDLGETDDAHVAFSAQNNFYYCPGLPFDPYFDKDGYEEIPAKATGNDRFDNRPSIYDWYETVKLNYGVDYYNGGTNHFDPIPNTWSKMADILLYWASLNIDGFRCDMAEMVPAEFWAYATRIVRERYPNLIFIGEVYDPARYHTYVNNGFDYLYDKVGMYDCMRAVIRGERSASSITNQWQNVDDINDHMLYFLENHDEQRVGSDFFCSDGYKAIPAVITNTLMLRNPFMIYSGQEFGEKGMDEEGFSGRDGRTTIFDYWAVDSIYRGYFDQDHLSDRQKQLSLKYKQIFQIALNEKAVSEGEFFDLMYVNSQSEKFNPRSQYAFLRKHEDEVLFIVVNFISDPVNVNVMIPAHAFNYLHMPETETKAVDLLTGEQMFFQLKQDHELHIDILPYSGRIIKFNIKMQEKSVVLNTHNKEEFPPSHTAEHLLNQVMMQMFGCERSHNAHIERKKSKISYILDHKPTRLDEKAIAKKMNELIDADLPVTFEFINKKDLPENIKLDRLPDDVSDTIRIVRIGDFDICPCIGKHVRSTSQIGNFEILGTNWDEKEHSFRIRYKVV